MNPKPIRFYPVSPIKVIQPFGTNLANTDAPEVSHG
jgi:hypothetical protein